jgi:hypothetical protein
MSRDRSRPTPIREISVAVIAFLASTAVLGMPWARVVPLSSSFIVWLQRIMPILSPGNVTLGRSSKGAWEPLLAMIFALPFLLPMSTSGQRSTRLSRVIGVLLIGFAIAPLIGTGNAPNSLASWEGALVIAATSLLGILLVGLGVSEWRLARSVSHPWLRAFAGSCCLTGICLATFVFMPIGILLLVPTYVLGALSTWRSQARD